MTGVDDAPRLCQLKHTLGEIEACPQGACAYWEAGGALLDSGCALDRLGIDLRRPDLAAYLLELRGALETARDAHEREEARRTFAGLVPPELSDH